MTRPVVLLPGLLCDQDVWRDQMAVLARDYQPWRPGFLDHASIGDMAEAVLAAAPPRFALAGHSMGGRVALEVVRRAPERVERLALLDTGFHPARPGEDQGRAALVELAAREGMAALAGRWLPPMLGARRAGDAALTARLTAMVERASPELFRRQTEALLGRPDAWPGLPAIACPTMVIVGELDTWSPPAQHAQMAAAIPGAAFRTIPGAGHMSPVEQPQAVAEALLAWMRLPGLGQAVA